MDSCDSKQKYPLLGGVHYSACLILSGFTVHNKNNCKIIIWKKNSFTNRIRYCMQKYRSLIANKINTLSVKKTGEK